ncbi:MATE efflux family protein 1-like protein [Corchorus capsularis]|uniref:MATE efflux family protein 1-like protein n=1 Tax=Corchorus capsularis TaxID=210143 RepID=A0A1R3HKW6_COCAP|nr:MATE efflux family protein 1-like protein [Corchorus capsularis]
MLKPVQQYLTLRSLGAPGLLLSLAAQGVFRGLKDTRTPLHAIIVGDSVNVILDPIFIFTLDLGVRGAAIAHVLSQSKQPEGGHLGCVDLAGAYFQRLVVLGSNVGQFDYKMRFGRYLEGDVDRIRANGLNANVDGRPEEGRSKGSDIVLEV